jgi:hypothetical protein
VIRWILALAIGVLAAWLAYGRARSTSRAYALPLGALRALAVTVVAALLFGAPMGRARPLAPLIAIDASASWRRAAGDDSSAVRAWRTRIADSVLRTMPTDAPLILAGDSLRDVTRDELASITPADAASRMRPAVDRAASLGRALVLVTDGEVDDADALTDAPPGSRVVRPVATPRRDVAVADLAVPASATAADTVTASATIVSGGVATPDGTLHLLLDGVSVATAPVPALAPFASTRISAPLVLPRGARVALVQAVVQVASDVEARNDTLSASIDIGDRPTAVFVSTSPDLDVREALTVLRGALDVPTRAYLRVAPGVWRVEGSLAPIAETEVRARAAAAGLFIVHGDTSFKATGTGSAARALWVPAPPTALARAGETARTPEWYASAAPASPLMAALSGLPFDSLPPISLAGAADTNGARVSPVLTAQLGKRGAAVTAIAAREDRGARTVVISGSGYSGWALRGGRSREAFTALWGAIFDWLAAGRGDVRAARPVAGIVRAGEPVAWRRGGGDSVVTVQLAKRGPAPATASGTAAAPTALTLRFSDRSFETSTAPLPAGVYDVTATGGRSVLVVNAAREWIPRAPSVQGGALSRGAAGSDAPRLADAGWPFALALLLLCGEWIGRRLGGHR